MEQRKRFLAGRVRDELKSELGEALSGIQQWQQSEQESEEGTESKGKCGCDRSQIMTKQIFHVD